MNTVFFKKIKYGFLLFPALLLLLFFFLLPVIGSLLYALTDQQLIGQRIDEVSFIGFDNFIHFFSDSIVIPMLAHTLFLILVAALVQQLLGVFLAKLLSNKKIGFKKFIHACLYSGWLMPEAATAFIFFFLFSIDGEMNQILLLSGNVSRVWLTDSPLLVIALAQLWSGTAFSLIIYETALDQVPILLTDSARCDGANSFQIFFGITIPALADTIRSNTAILILNNLGVFGLVFMLTGGGPMHRSTTFPIFVFKNAIAGADTGYGMALSFILFIISIVISLAHVTIVNQENKEIEC